MKRIISICLLSVSAIYAMAAPQNNNKNVLDIKSQITDSNIIYPESYEADTQKMMEGWYMKNYTATDDRYRRLGDVKTDDMTIRQRLAALPTVIDMPFNSIVRNYIDRYTARGREQVAALLGLGIYYLPIFEQALEEQGLPLELKYLPVIESALDPNAVSKHGAAGLWQFMIATAKGLGLEVNSLVDERRDPYLSSKTAARYLRDLYDSYGDWSLAIAAYNCGPGAVNKAIRRAGGDPKSHDFWSIYYYLSPETRGYVPMFIAANYVMNYHKDHNISPVLPTKPLVTDTIMVNNRVHLEQISHVLDIPIDELKVLNPQFRANLIPGTPEHPYTLILPSQQCHAYLMSEADIKAYEADKYLRRVNAEPGGQPSQNEPDAGDTSDRLLANADDIPAADDSAALDEAQHMRGDSSDNRTGDSEFARARRRTRDMNAPRTSNWTDQTETQAKSAQAPAKSGSNKKKNTSAKAPAPASHTVKNGENLYVIAKRYGVSLADLKKANPGKGDRLQIGDKLNLPSGTKASSSSAKSKSKSTGSNKKKSKKRRR